MGWRPIPMGPMPTIELPNRLTSSSLLSARQKDTDDQITIWHVFIYKYFATKKNFVPSLDALSRNGSSSPVVNLRVKTADNCYHPALHRAESIHVEVNHRIWE